jgi:hypothetical protein
MEERMMLMQESTPEMIAQWQSIWHEYKDKLRPNRKSGKEILTYLYEKYTLVERQDEESKQIVISNVLQNKPNAEKLPVGKQPSAVAFNIENTGEGQRLYKEQDDVFMGTEILVGIDLESGYYLVEGSSLLYDELCAFQGLDEIDIQNYFLVSQYISALKKINLLDRVV